MADSCVDILNGVDNHAYYKANLMIFFGPGFTYNDNTHRIMASDC